jgi:hypothetical protein
MSGHLTRMWPNRNVCTILVAKAEGKRPRCMWMHCINISLRDIGRIGMDLIGLSQDRNQCRALANTVLNLRVL